MTLLPRCISQLVQAFRLEAPDLVVSVYDLVETNA